MCSTSSTLETSSLLSCKYGDRATNSLTSPSRPWLGLFYTVALFQAPRGKLTEQRSFCRSGKSNRTLKECGRWTLKLEFCNRIVATSCFVDKCVMFVKLASDVDSVFAQDSYSTMWWRLKKRLKTRFLTITLILSLTLSSWLKNLVLGVDLKDLKAFSINESDSSTERL